MRCACAEEKGMPLRRKKRECTCAERNELRKRILLLYVQAHLILVCACTSHFGMRMRISISGAHGHLILVCTCASDLGRMQVGGHNKHKTQACFFFKCCIPLKLVKKYLSERF